MAQQLVKEAYCAPSPNKPPAAVEDETHIEKPEVVTQNVSEQKVTIEANNDPPSIAVNSSSGASPAEIADPPNVPKSQTTRMTKDDTRYWRALSLLPDKSSVKRVMAGSDLSESDPSDSSSESESEELSTESSEDKWYLRKEKSRKSSKQTSQVADKKRLRTSQMHLDESEPSEDSSDDPNARILAMEPESDHSSDSETTKCGKHAARMKHRAQLNLLKHQQGSLKHEPPFTYNGEVNSSTFKKWVREVCDWRDHAKLSTKQSLKMLGKYLGGNTYRFYECDVLDLKKRYSLMEFFEHLFDYIFPTDFWMMQRQKFRDCKQEGHHSIHDYIR
ncbi:hypothetical protein EV424DRAFT_1535456 [Suillus variegatus]|nr:hypothetical protein EV424DRAFT_1535456 [Suillus variegatus]